MLPVGAVGEVLTGLGAEKGTVHDFLRTSHREHHRNGVSYVGIAVMPDNNCWLLAGPDGDEIATLLDAAGSTAAEVMKLENLQ
jgi:hypothetical protein